MKWARHIRSVLAQHPLTETVDKGMKKAGTGASISTRMTVALPTPGRYIGGHPVRGFFCEEKTGRLGWHYDIVKTERMEEKGVSRDLTPVTLRKDGSGDKWNSGKQ